MTDPAGSAASVHGARGNAFTSAVQHYQNTLLTYRDVMQGPIRCHPGLGRAGDSRCFHQHAAKVSIRTQDNRTLAKESTAQGYAPEQQHPRHEYCPQQPTYPKTATGLCRAGQRLGAL